MAAKALEYVPDNSRIGLGSGHTVEPFLEALGKRIRGGARIQGVPSSEATAQRARDLGIPLTDLSPDDPLAVIVDGADEVEQGTLNLIKGWGGALVRERIVTAASLQQIIVVGPEKLVDCLGTRGRLPVEVLPFAAPFCRRRIEQISGMGIAHPVVRGGEDHPFVSDNGNWILDCAIQPQQEPALLERALLAIPGVVDTGLFLGTATLVLVAEGSTVRELRRPE
ncbi:MAG: ribose-5-phosphate isomerase RpiA [Planctomycetes bacterium]|nr:ribose-5-phosphate isomerase RpiA [Planctomycetota bacterium]